MTILERFDAEDGSGRKHAMPSRGTGLKGASHCQLSGQGSSA
jgi:hypothetical protein